MARAAAGHVIRPIRIFGAIAVAGALAAPLALGGLPIPRAFLAMCAAAALAFAVNRRPTRRRQRPVFVRAAWIGAAALMFAAMPSHPRAGAGGLGFAISFGELAGIAAVALLLLAAIVRAAQGVRADPDDRLLIGALAGIVAFAALFVTELPPPSAAWLHPFAVLIGAALARANGNLRVP